MQHRRKPPRAITPEYLDKAALFYLERYASSAENLARVLMRRVEKAARVGISDREEGKAMVAALVDRYRTRGLLDDRTYAEGRAKSLLRQGRPRAAIARRLAAKGVGSEAIDAALDGLVEDSADPDLSAAVAYARRRRLGPYRVKDRAGFRDRDLAALGRAGFSYDLARKVVAAETPEVLEAMLAEAAPE
jgi:regulatory protein